MVTPEEILDFWFGPDATNSEITGRQAGLWWGKSESVDREIVSRFGDAVVRATRGRFEQ